MDFFTDRIKPIYFKYLTAAFGSALITSIYGIVDMTMVGDYQGPEGTAALAMVMPIWNIIYRLGLLMGIGGSVLLSTLRGESSENLRQSNEYFTAAVIGAAVLAALTWIGLIFFDKQLLVLFGAGFATAAESTLSFLIMLTHFLGKKNTLALVKPGNPLSKLREITVTGFATFFIDVAMGILTVLFNRQILRYLGGERALGLRDHHQYQWLCPMLCLQRGAGRPAHHLHQFRGQQRGPHSGNLTCGPSRFSPCSGRFSALRSPISTPRFS